MREERYYGENSNDSITQSNKNCTFSAKQKFFCLNSGGVTGQRSIRTDYTMAGNNDRNWITPVRTSNCLKTARYADTASQLFIGNCCTVRNIAKLFPYTQLKCRAEQIHWNRKFSKLAVEISR